MMGKIFGAVVIIALLAYAFTVMNKTTENIEANMKQAISVQEQLESEGLPPQPAQPPSNLTGADTAQDAQPEAVQPESVDEGAAMEAMPEAAPEEDEDAEIAPVEDEGVPMEEEADSELQTP